MFFKKKIFINNFIIIGKFFSSNSKNNMEGHLDVNNNGDNNFFIEDGIDENLNEIKFKDVAFLSTKNYDENLSSEVDLVDSKLETDSDIEIKFFFKFLRYFENYSYKIDDFFYKLRFFLIKKFSNLNFFFFLIFLIFFLFMFF